MGICASYQYRTKGGNLIRWPQPAAAAAATKIIFPDGRIQEFKEPIKASHILSQNPNTFLCNSELMYVNSRMPQVPEDEELQLDRLYFLMPMSQSQATLSLQQLCSLATKAAAALSDDLDKVICYDSQQKMMQFAGGGRSTQQGCCKVPVGFKIIGIMKVTKST